MPPCSARCKPIQIVELYEEHGLMSITWFVCALVAAIMLAILKELTGKPWLSIWGYWGIARVLLVASILRAFAPTVGLLG